MDLKESKNLLSNKMKKYLFLFSFLISVFVSLPSYATHLIGGSLGYEFLGVTATNEFQFKIILVTYTNCGPGSNVPQPEGPILTVGIYEHDIQNDPLAGIDKSWLLDLDITLIDSTIIEPNLPGGCSVGASTCIYKGVYEGIVNLPLNFTGFHVLYERCCRNNSIVNLVAQESMTFHAYISPPLLENSSPQFTDDPIPFLCIGDTTTILNTAFDPDGDELVFSFVEPYDADQSSATNPAPNPPNPTMNWPINNVTYIANDISIFY